VSVVVFLVVKVVEFVIDVIDELVEIDLLEEGVI
jgi:hypothetical protein